MLHKKAEEEHINQDELFGVDRVHFIVNNFCNLKCTHCNRYMNTYPAEKKHNSDLETIKYDIHRVLSAIDSVAVGIVFGGEPFLHPDLDTIVGQLLKEKNLAAVLINTNGISNMKDRELKNMKDKRVRVAFSNYTHVLDDAQQKRFWDNAEYLKEHGVPVQVQNTVPTWQESPTLTYKGSDIEECTRKRKSCCFPYLFVFEHKVFACAFAMSLHDLGINEDVGDYVDITKYKDDKSLGIAIRNLKEKAYFRSCAFCEDEDGKPVKSAEQGYSERYALPQGSE
jgi:organic radical activating enzyme